MAEQQLMREVEEAIFYLVIFIGSICILLYFYVFPSIRRAIFFDDLALSSKVSDRAHTRLQKSSKKDSGGA